MWEILSILHVSLLRCNILAEFYGTIAFLIQLLQFLGRWPPLPRTSRIIKNTQFLRQHLRLHWRQ